MPDREFWQNIIANHYAIPDEADLLELTDELLDYLASPDPELRDTFAYNILSRWLAIYRYHNTEQLLVMTHWLLEQVDKGIGEIDTDTVFLRSYSIAMLALIVYRDIKEHFMSKEDISLILDTAQSYLLYEKDLRPYDPEKGWINAIASVSGLLRYLAMHELTTGEQLQDILATVLQKVCQSAEQAFDHDEDDRLARVVIPVMIHSDLIRIEYTGWLAQFKLWLTTHDTAGQYDANHNATYQNIKRFLRALHMQMLLTPRLSESAESAQVDLLDVIRDFTL